LVAYTWETGAFEKDFQEELSAMRILLYATAIQSVD
jgi:hypothetical protein